MRGFRALGRVNRQHMRDASCGLLLHVLSQAGMLYLPEDATLSNQSVGGPSNLPNPMSSVRGGRCNRIWIRRSAVSTLTKDPYKSRLIWQTERIRKNAAT
jgi:hypothetical protein